MSRSRSQPTEVTGKVSCCFSGNVVWGLQPSPGGEAPSTARQSLLLHSQGNGSLASSFPGVQEDSTLGRNRTGAGSPQQHHLTPHASCVAAGGGWPSPLPFIIRTQPDRRYLFLESVGLYQQTLTYSIISPHISGPHTALLSLGLQHSPTPVLERTQGCIAYGKGSGLPASFNIGLQNDSYP